MRIRRLTKLTRNDEKIQLEAMNIVLPSLQLSSEAQKSSVFC